MLAAAVCMAFRRPIAEADCAGVVCAAAASKGAGCIAGRAGFARSNREALSVLHGHSRFGGVQRCGERTSGSITLAPRGGRPLGSGRQLPPQLTVGRRPLGGGGGGGGGAPEGGVKGGRMGGGIGGAGGGAPAGSVGGGGPSGAIRGGGGGGGPGWGNSGCWGGSQLVWPCQPC